MSGKHIPLTIGSKLFDFSRPYIMGILNITPDSFSDGGQFFYPSKAIDHALFLQDAGADILDIGGESTRPGSDPVSLDQELDRVIPVIEKLAPQLSIPISIDTYKSEVARQALKAGAVMINDITALNYDPDMALLAARTDVPVVLMHIKGTPKTMQKNPTYNDLLAEIKKYFEKSIALAEKAGVDRNKLVIDPGIGFGKSVEDNYRLISNLDYFGQLNLPILIGASRKRFLSDNNKYSESERLEQSLAAACAAVLNGADFVRVHDVPQTKKALRVIENLRINR